MNGKISKTCMEENPNVLIRTLTMLYSIASYLIGVVALVYLILFIADLWVPVTINHGAGIAPATGLAGAYSGTWG